ncbi:hypothetical protein Hanom_Chr07g00670541 [Helianthus anomalus]
MLPCHRHKDREQLLCHPMLCWCSSPYRSAYVCGWSLIGIGCRVIPVWKRGLE